MDEALVQQVTDELEALRWRGDHFRDKYETLAKVLWKHGCPDLNVASDKALEWLEKALAAGYGNE